MASPVRPISMDEARTVVPSWDENEEANFCAILAETVGTLDDAGIPFVLMGGIGSASHGRPRWTHDIDVFVRPEDAKRAIEVLAAADFETEETYPDWLFKAFKSDIMVDLIFKSSGGILLDEEMISRGQAIQFKGVDVKVIPPEDLVVIKAVVHDEHMPRHWHDALAVIAIADIDWEYLVRRARQYGARRVLSLLLYAQSNDLIVPTGPIRALFDAIYAE
ncbi:MAG TPA: nucleotidyltransferase [Acidimicrobiales bacterium]|jgi:predicted nucleotidyltransferase|nr:nucleotidyltransferase [Acidimicrobiales bacterium]